MRRVQVLLTKQLGAADRANWKNQAILPISDGVYPDRPDDIRPYRPLGQTFHARHEVSGLKLVLRLRGSAYQLTKVRLPEDYLQYQLISRQAYLAK